MSKPNHTEPVAQAIAILFIAAFIVYLPLSGAGCANSEVAAHPDTIDDKTNDIQKHVVGIDQTTKQITGADNEPRKQTILGHTAAIVIDAKGIHIETAGARTADAANEKELKAYKSNPLVPVAMFLWKWCKIILGLTVGLYVLALVGGFFNPATFMFSISQELVRFLPLANMIRWVHNLFGSRILSVPAMLVPKAVGDSKAPAATLTT